MCIRVRFTIWKEGLRKGKSPIVHRTLGTKEQMLVYDDELANEVSSVRVPLDMRKRWSLEKDECIILGEMAVSIERYFSQPMDIEWAKDGVTGEIYIVQARPETIHSKAEHNKMLMYKIDEKLASDLKRKGRVMASGQAVGKRIGVGKVRVFRSYSEVLDKKRELGKLLDLSLIHI